MLEQLLRTLVNQGQQTVVENPQIPNDLNRQVIGEAGGAIMNVLQGMMANGGLAQIMRLFAAGGQGQAAGLAGMLSNPMVQQMIQSFTGKLTNQYRLSPDAAQQVGQSLIPSVLQNFTNQVSDPSDPSIDLNGIMRTLAGGQAGGFDFNSLASRFAGPSQEPENDSQLQDLFASLTGAARSRQEQQQQQPASGDPIMDMLSQLMK
jgi:hypothetical protein